MFPSVFCTAMGSTLGLVCIYIVSVVLSIICASAINKSSYLTGVAMPEPRPIGGGMILVGILLVIRVASLLVTFFLAGYWDDGFWGNVAYNYGSASEYDALATFIYCEVFYAGINHVGTVFATYLFFKQRDIFPKVATWLFIAASITWMLDVGVGNWLMNDKVEPVWLIGFAGGQVLLCILLYYINFSERAVETFTVPHHSLIIEEY